MVNLNIVMMNKNTVMILTMYSNVKNNIGNNNDSTTTVIIK